MLSNLPPGCSDSDIPGNTPIDKVVDKAISDEECIACEYYDDEKFWCCDCFQQGGEAYQSYWIEADSVKIAERIRAEADTREDGHSDD